MKQRHVVGCIIVLAFVVYSLMSFSNSLTPYVSFAQAKTAKSDVQVRGVLTSEKVTVADNGKTIKFNLRDEAGEEVPVVYRGTKPDGLDEATSVVVVGRYQSGQFNADKLLIKCPSKYQGSVKKT